MSIECFDTYFKEGRKIVTVKDVEPEKFISAFSQHLKRQGRFELPKWADVVKTSKAKELPPSDPDWLYVRTASMVRKIYIRKGMGRQEEPKSREELVERLRSHTQHCESCSQALSLSKDLQRLGELLVILGLLTSSLSEQLKVSSAVVTILAAVVVALSRELEKQLTMGEYPPPRNR
eukprot:s2706_g5.t1